MVVLEKILGKGKMSHAQTTILKESMGELVVTVLLC